MTRCCVQYRDKLLLLVILLVRVYPGHEVSVCLCVNHTPVSIECADWPRLHDMFKARDANAWQREFPVGFPTEVSALYSLFINFVTILLLVWKAEAWLKQNMSCWSVNSFDFALEKLHSHWNARAIFPRKIERINRPTRHVFLQSHILSLLPLQVPVMPHEISSDMLNDVTWC